MRDFTTEDFSGAGQYLIRNDKPEGEYVSPGFMSTIMKKVGYIMGNDRILKNAPTGLYTLTSMADGLTQCGYFDQRDDPEYGKNPHTPHPETWIFNQFNNLQDIVDYLNNPELCKQEYRFATQEEVVRVVLYQKSRWR